jgi:hypothetical protein
MTNELPETLRERFERIYRFECMSHPLGIELALPETAENPPVLTQEE